MLARSKRDCSAGPHLRASQDCCARCGGGRGAKIDLSNCYWSVHLPPAMAGAVRVAAAGTKYALVRVPFGWHQALGVVQHLIAAVLSELPDTQVVVVQFLDDILFVGRDSQVTTRVARDTAAHLARKGFLVSPKSVLDTTQSLTWMGKQLCLNRSRVAHKPEGLADIVGRWVTFSLGHYTRKPLQRLLGRIGWLVRPGFSAGCFLAGARAWLCMGPSSARCMPFVVCRGLLEAIAAGGRGGSRRRPRVRRSGCTLTRRNAPSRQVGFLWGYGALRAPLSAGAPHGLMPSNLLNWMVLCVLLTRPGVLRAGTWTLSWTTWAR